MSLRVWLPLNGTLDNQGLDSVVITNNGATIDNSGKIGKCYSFSGNDYLFFPCSFPNEDWSYSIWFYTTATSTQTLGCCRNGVGFGFSVFLISNKLRIDGVIGQNIQWTTPYIFPTNVWVNLIITSKNGLIKYYINGEYQSSKTVARDISKLGTVFSIGASQTNGSEWGNFFKGKINDVRIYDHALSLLEVKQISQGLILHYPLNNNGFGQENLLPVSDSTIINSTKSFEFQGWVQSFYTKTWMNEHLISGKQYILSYTVTCLSIPDSTYIFKENRHSPILVHQGSGLNQVTITNDGIKNTKMSVGQSRSYKCIFTFSTISESQEYYGLCGYTALYRNSSNVAQYAKFRIDNLKLEEGKIATPWCPNKADELYQRMKINDNIEYDCSGYQKNGEKISISYNSDTPKYDVSSVFSASPSVIKIPNQNYAIQGSQNMTISVWAYKEDWSQYSQRIYSCTEGGGFNVQPTSSGQIEWAVNVYTDAEKTSHKYDTNLYIRIPKTNFSSGWHMFTWVYTTEGTSLYIDGVLEKTMIGTSYGLYFNPTAPLILGGEATAKEYTSPYLNGKLSDFRIYCTALSSEDIILLYNNSAYIDNQGNVYGAMYKEV